MYQPHLHPIPASPASPSSTLCLNPPLPRSACDRDIYLAIAAMYIRQSKLRHLREYKYSSIDKSLVSRYILKPFYTNVFIHVFPMSMAFVFLPPPARSALTGPDPT